MKKKALLFFVLCCFLVTSEANGYVLSNGKHSTSTDITWSMKDNLAGTDYEKTIIEALNSWERSVPGLTFKRIDSRLSQLYFLANEEGLTNVMATTESWPAEGTYAFSFIEINSTYFNTSSAWQNLGTITHEIGHALGLKHVDSPQSIMYGARDIRKVNCPTEDDILGVKNIYGL